VNPDTEQLLREYVERQNTEAAEGYSVRNLRKSIENIADGLSKHEQECTDHRKSEAMRAASMNKRIETLEAESSRPIPPATRSLPPMRSREDSTHDLHETADKLTTALFEGLRDPDKTPEDAIKKAVKEIEEEKARARRLAELEAAEAERQAAESQAIADAAKRKEERRKLIGRLAVAAVGGGSIFVPLFEALKSIGHTH